MNREENNIPTYPSLRTMTLKDGKDEQRVTGFLVYCFEREQFLQEFPGLHACNIATEPPRLDDQVEPTSTLFCTTEPVPLRNADFPVRSIQMAEIKESRRPTLGEMEDFCAHPSIAQAFASHTKEYLPFDVNGERIYSRDEWNRMNTLAERDVRVAEGIRELKRTITASVMERDKKAFRVDCNLAEPLQKILDAGFHTGQSDSGTVADHPNYRYIEDSKLGLYSKGDPIKPGIGSYLTFWKPGAEGVAANTERQIEMVRESALATGWCVHDMPCFGQPSIRLSLPLTKDMSSSLQIHREGTDVMKELHPELTLWDDTNLYLDTKSAVEEDLIDRHGGRMEWTDRSVMKRWESFANNLAWRMEIEQSTGWINANDLPGRIPDKETESRLEQEHLANRTSIVESHVDEWHLYHRLQERFYDETARKHGFDGFDENDAGTAVRNYTALGKQADEDTLSRLEAFKKDRDVGFEPIFAFSERITAQTVRQMDDEAQRYLQAIYAITAPLARQRMDAQRLSDVSVYASGPEYNRRYHIRCNIDSQPQLSKELSAEDARRWRDTPGTVSLTGFAVKYFREELDRDRSQEQVTKLGR